MRTPRIPKNPSFLVPASIGDFVGLYSACDFHVLGRNAGWKGLHANAGWFIEIQHRRPKYNHYYKEFQKLEVVHGELLGSNNIIITHQSAAYLSYEPVGWIVA